MNKKELVRSIACKTGLSKDQSKAAVDAVFESITEAMISGDYVKIVGFGIFEVKNRAPRRGWDMRRGEAVFIPEQRVPSFVPGGSLKLKFKE